MINPVGSSGYTQETQPVSSEASRTDTQNNAEQKGDSVSLSNPAAMMADFFSGLHIQYTPGKAITLDDMESGLESLKRDFKDKTTTAFLENGIPLDPPVELTSDGEGKVRVKGDHPNKTQIEQLFENKPELRDDFAATSTLGSMVEAGREYIEFSKEYAKDPYAAVAKYGHMFDGMKDEPFSILIGMEAES